MTFRRYTAIGMFVSPSDPSTRLVRPPTAPFVAVDSFDGMRMAVEKMREACGDGLELTEVRLLDLGPVDE
jgi:hypothetical protein